MRRCVYLSSSQWFHLKHQWDYPYWIWCGGSAQSVKSLCHMRLWSFKSKNTVENLTSLKITFILHRNDSFLYRCYYRKLNFLRGNCTSFGTLFLSLTSPCRENAKAHLAPYSLHTYSLVSFFLLAPLSVVNYPSHHYRVCLTNAVLRIYAANPASVSSTSWSPNAYENTFPLPMCRFP